MGEQERRTHPRQDLETAAELTVEVSEPFDDAADKRTHERVNVNYEINIEAGLKIRGQEVMRLTIVGSTIDVSLGGMLIKVDREVLPGARCEVHFPDAEGQIEPDKTWGRVRRSRVIAKGFELAVQFDTPLDLLQSE